MFIDPDMPDIYYCPGSVPPTTCPMDAAKYLASSNISRSTFCISYLPSSSSTHPLLFSSPLIFQPILRSPSHIFHPPYLPYLPLTFLHLPFTLLLIHPSFLFLSSPIPPLSSNPSSPFPTSPHPSFPMIGCNVFIEK